MSTGETLLNNALHAIDRVHEDQSIDLGTTVGYLERIVAHARALVDAIQDDLERYPEG